MKYRYLLTSMVVSGMMNLVFAQSSQNINLQSMAKDTSQIVPLSGQQINVVLPESGGTYVDATTTVLPFLWLCIRWFSQSMDTTERY